MMRRGKASTGSTRSMRRSVRAARGPPAPRRRCPRAPPWPRSLRPPPPPPPPPRPPPRDPHTHIIYKVTTATHNNKVTMATYTHNNNSSNSSSNPPKISTLQFAPPAVQNHNLFPRPHWNTAPCSDQEGSNYNLNNRQSRQVRKTEDGHNSQCMIKGICTLSLSFKAQFSMSILILLNLTKVLV